jgi:hypothetical protein
MEKMNRKAIFFTIVSLFVVLLFVASFRLSTRFKISESEIESTRAKVRILNSLVTDFENIYFEKILYVASKNTLIGLSRYYATKNFDGIELETSKAMDTVMQLGNYSYRNTSVDLISKGYMKYEYTLESQVKNISEAIRGFGLIVEDLDFKVIRTDQIDPFTVRVFADVNYNFRDEKNIVVWKGAKEVNTTVTIYGMTLYDFEGYPSSDSENIMAVNDSWRIDTGFLTEPSFVNKMSGRLVKGIGICSPLFNNSKGHSCADDFGSDYGD